MNTFFFMKLNSILYSVVKFWGTAAIGTSIKEDIV